MTDASIYDFGVILVIIAIAFAAAASAAIGFWLKVWPPKDERNRLRWSRWVGRLFFSFLVLAGMLLFLLALGWVLDLTFLGYIGPPGRGE